MLILIHVASNTGQCWNFKQSMGARNRLGIVLPYQPARLSLESILGLIKSLKIRAQVLPSTEREERLGTGKGMSDIMPMIAEIWCSWSKSHASKLASIFLCIFSPISFNWVGSHHGSNIYIKTPNPKCRLCWCLI